VIHNNISSVFQKHTAENKQIKSKQKHKMEFSERMKRAMNASKEIFRFSFQWGFVPMVVYLGKLIAPYIWGTYLNMQFLPHFLKGFRRGQDSLPGGEMPPPLTLASIFWG
jgi:multidrug efflux pump subunit AcrB